MNRFKLSYNGRKRMIIAMCLVIALPVVSPMFLLAQSPSTAASTTQAPPSQPVRITKANYELAARWTAEKVGKLVFDTAVTPHWLETGDRFWYSYETSQGRHYYIVDPVKKTKAPLFDNAKIAAMLTTALRTPYDSQHLPIKSLKFMKNDTVVRFDVDVPKDSSVGAGVKAEENPDTQDQMSDDQDQTQDNDSDNPQQRRGQGGGAGQTDDASSTTKTVYFDYDIATGKLTMLEDYKPPQKPRWASVSPDEKTIIFARGHNLYMMDADNYAKAQKKADDSSIVETQITTDGEEHWGYDRRLMEEEKKQFQRQERDKKTPRVPPIQIYWSRDSKKFSVVRSDERKVADLWVINSLSNPRPTLETYRYAMPGEANVPQFQIEVFDRDSKAKTLVKADKFKDQTVQISTARTTAAAREHEKTEPQWLSDTTDKLYFTRLSRDMHRLDVCVASPESGDVKVLIEERLNTYIESKPLRLVNNGQEILFWSERDGWGHYYLFDGNGNLKNQITSGEFVDNTIESIDEKGRTLVISGFGHEPSEDPYFSHTYKVNFDGTGFKLLDPGDASHSASISDSGKYFVDNFSRINTAPKSVLYDNLGTKVLDLETTDVSDLLDSGFKFPEPFKVKADDGITDLYGTMYKPFDFDLNKKYPIIAYVYPGPQTESVTKTFSPKNANVALAQFGFIVIEVGNRGGNPDRSKWYHNFGYGNLRDYGLADKKAAIEQLARRYPWIDIDKVGITGHSGGGFMSTAATLVYPDFFKVAVSESGNHENNIYNHTWSEKHHGVKEVTDKDGNVKFEYNIEKNSDIAKNLKGHLMLSTGDMDDNVNMAATIRMADALIKANKRFDFVILPGKRHAYADAASYFFWIRADYFCRYLIGDVPDSVDLIELQKEKEQSGDKRRTGAAGRQQ
ncbi:MAG TPA: DPP IV N-terminal domain-containing protein [Blastocatellia bacterium]|nr:DPP IV N-terminal domain-containing protein [Blastocatellia bacterium]